MFLNPVNEIDDGLHETLIFNSTHQLSVPDGERLAVPYDNCLTPVNHLFTLFDSTFRCLEEGTYGISFSVILKIDGGPNDLKGSVQGYIEVAPSGSQYRAGFVLAEDVLIGTTVFDTYIMSYSASIYLKKGWTFQVLLEKVVNTIDVICSPISANGVKTVLSIQRL